jgi:hypothetical protein
VPPPLCHVSEHCIVNDFEPPSLDVGGGNVPDFKEGDGWPGYLPMLSNIPLRWMIKEIIAADPNGIIFCKGEMSRFGIDLDTFRKQAKDEKAKKAKDEKAKRENLSPELSEAEIFKPQHYWNKIYSAVTSDVRSPINDEMMKMPLWWLLEFFPIIESRQYGKNYWTQSIRYVRSFLSLPLFSLGAIRFACL